MRIMQLAVQNIKRIKAVACELKDGVVVISGDNRQGKTSLLDAIAMALGGEKLVPKKPIRDGEETGFAQVVVGDIEVTRTWKNPYQSKLEIRNADGTMIMTKPQQFLNDRIGENSLDVMNFINMTADQQVKFFQKITGLDVHDMREKLNVMYMDRRVYNRELDTVKAKLSEYPAELKKPEKIDASGIKEELQKAMKHNMALTMDKGKLDNAIADLRGAESKLKEIQEQILDKEKQISDLRLALKGKEIIDVEPMQKKVAHFENYAKAEVEYKTWKEHKRNFDELKAKIAGLQDQMDKLSEEIDDKIKASEMPIPDLEFDGKEIRYHGIPIDQCSEEERITIGIAIGVQENPRLRTLLVRDASGIGKKALKRIEQVAKEKEYQIILEKQADTKGDTIYIEDGEMK